MKVFREHQSHLTKRSWQATSQCWSTNSKFLHYNKTKSWQCFNSIIQPQPSSVWCIRRIQAEIQNQHIQRREQASNDICHPFHQATKMFDLIDSDKHETLNVTHLLTWKNRTSFQLTALIMKWNHLHASNESWLIVFVLF